MAEGGSLHREAIATVQLTYSSENPILVDYIKEEPEEELESEVLQLSDVEQPPPPPTPQSSQAQHLPITHQVWAGVSPVVSPLVLESPPRPTFFAITQRVILVQEPLPGGKRHITFTCSMRRQIRKQGRQFLLVASPLQPPKEYI